MPLADFPTFLSEISKFKGWIQQQKNIFQVVKLELCSDHFSGTLS
jgi:hypothetical protein